MPVCVYEGCMSGSKSKKVRNRVCGRLYRFPKDPVMRKKWLEQIKRGTSVTKVNFETGVVCSLHFTDDCLAEKSYAQKMGNYSPVSRRRILPSAIPLSKFGYHYDDIPYDRFHMTCESGTPDSRNKCVPCTTTTPRGLFKVTDLENAAIKKEGNGEEFKQENEFVVETNLPEPNVEWKPFDLYIKKEGNGEEFKQENEFVVETNLPEPNVEWKPFDLYIKKEGNGEEFKQENEFVVETNLPELYVELRPFELNEILNAFEESTLNNAKHIVT